MKDSRWYWTLCMESVPEDPLLAFCPLYHPNVALVYYILLFFMVSPHFLKTSIYSCITQITWTVNLQRFMVFGIWQAMSISYFLWSSLVLLTIMFFDTYCTFSWPWLFELLHSWVWLIFCTNIRSSFLMTMARSSTKSSSTSSSFFDIFISTTLLSLIYVFSLICLYYSSLFVLFSLDLDCWEFANFHYLNSLSSFSIDNASNAFFVVTPLLIVFPVIEQIKFPSPIHFSYKFISSFYVEVLLARVDVSFTESLKNFRVSFSSINLMLVGFHFLWKGFPLVNTFCSVNPTSLSLYYYCFPCCLPQNPF